MRVNIYIYIYIMSACVSVLSKSACTCMLEFIWTMLWHSNWPLWHSNWPLWHSNWPLWHSNWPLWHFKQLECIHVLYWGLQNKWEPLRRISSSKLAQIVVEKRWKFPFILQVAVRSSCMNIECIACMHDIHVHMHVYTWYVYMYLHMRECVHISG